jgi:hypothetical protein
MVEVRTAQGLLLSLPLDDVSDGFVLKDVGGLGPVNATIVTSSFAQMDGTQYHSASREDREITITLEFESDYVTNTVHDLRQRAYKFFMSKRWIGLRFYDSGGLEVDIQGVVKTCEPSIFTKEPGVDVTIICPNPDFYNRVPEVKTGNSTSSTTETLIDYIGSVETGITFVLNVNRTLSAFTIYHRAPDGTIRIMDFSAPLVNGDVLTIGTVIGNKGASLNRLGTISSILYGISPQSNWLQLDQGNNYIRVYATGAAIPYTITYTDKYGGL